MTTPPLELDWKRFVDDVRALAAESPDFVYTPVDVDGVCRCRYFPDDANPQGCLIGAALARQGVDVKQMEEDIVAGRSKAALLGAQYALSLFGVPEHVRMWAARIQGRQDNGHPWAVAVDFADGDGVPA